MTARIRQNNFPRHHRLICSREFYYNFVFRTLQFFFPLLPHQLYSALISLTPPSYN